MKKFRIALISLLAFTFALTSCSQGKNPDTSDSSPASEQASASESENKETEKPKSGRPLIGVSLFYKRDEYYKDLETYFNKYAEKNDMDIIIQDADTKVATQTQQLEDFVTRGVDAIALAAVDPDGIVPAIEQAVASNIPVFTYDGDANTDKKTSFVGFDYTEDGELVGKWAADYISKNLGGKAKVAIIDFPASPIVCVQRADGFTKEVTKLPGVEIVARQDGKATRSDSMSVMENILTANPDVDLVYGINFDSAAGAAAAVEAAGLKDKVVVTGNGYGRELFQALDENNSAMKCFAVSMAETQAKDTIEAIAKTLKGESVPKSTISHSKVYDTETIKDFDYKKALGNN